MLTLEYTLTEKELFDYIYYTGWQSPEKKAYRRKYYIRNIGAFIALIGISSLVILDKQDIQNWPLLVILISIFLFGFYFIMQHHIRSHYKKWAKKRTLEAASEDGQGATMLTITAEGLFGKTNAIEVRYSWNAFQRKAIINNCYYLYIHSEQAVVIPFRAFGSEQERNTFEKLLSEHFPLLPDLNSLQHTS